MAKKSAGGAAKKVVRRRNRKNVDRGQAHIQSTFNNTIVTPTPRETLFLGRARVDWALEALVRTRLLPRRWRRRRPRRPRWSTV